MEIGGFEEIESTDEDTESSEDIVAAENIESTVASSVIFDEAFN
jgi:hypothetical protein